MRRTLWIGAIALTIASIATAQTEGAEDPAVAPPASRAEVLVLGTYHMANPGHDLVNMKADDVLAPERQKEVQQLVEVLKRFHPSKIAVEADVGDERIPKAYADYVAGRHKLTRNEIEQIGFRLGKALGQSTIYPTDADGDFPFQRVVDYAKANGQSSDLDAMLAATRKEVAAQGDYLASHTILQMMLLLNSDEHVARDMGFYYRAAEFGEQGDWAGADLVAEWVRRNLRIYTNVMQLIDSPDERVLVIFGAGHLGWLRQAFDGNPEIRLRRLDEFGE